MQKDNKVTVRSHSKEREWLLNLGQGNLVQGVRTLVEQTQSGYPNSNGAGRDKNRQLKK